MRREPLKAGEGKYLTNGKVHGKQIYLAEGESAEDYKKISKEEYEAIREQEEENEY